VSRGLPLRTCIGCGARAPQSQLVRIVVDANGALAPDPARRASGRGGYLHHDPGCWNSFARRKGPVRSLRRSASRVERQALAARLHADSAL